MIVINLIQVDQALKILGSKINSNTIIIFDDIQNNLQFKDFVEKNKKDFSVFEFEGKYIGSLIRII